MPLASGNKLGHCEIQSPLAADGIVVAWCADSTESLHRTVAHERPRPSSPFRRKCMTTLFSPKCLVLAVIAMAAVAIGAPAQNLRAPGMTLVVDETQASRRIAFV